MKFSLKKLFTTNNVIKFLYILFLFGVVYSLFSKKLVLEGYIDCMKIPNKNKTECNKLYPECKWINRNYYKNGVFQYNEQDCVGPDIYLQKK